MDEVFYGKYFLPDKMLFIAKVTEYRSYERKLCALIGGYYETFISSR